MSSRFHSRFQRPLRVSTADLSFSQSCNASFVSIIVTCKGRLSHFEQTLPLLLSQQFSGSFEIIVVDYGDPDWCFDWARQQKNNQIKCLRVLDRNSNFNLSRARNCGASVAEGHVLCFVDADSITHSTFIEGATEDIRSDRAVLTVRDHRDGNITTAGVCAVRKSAYLATRGYDESIKGWASEDRDFYNRVSRLGPIGYFPRHLLPASLPHGDEARSQFYEVKDIHESWHMNVFRIKRVTRQVNPAGYGQAVAMIASRQTDWVPVTRLIGHPAVSSGDVKVDCGEPGHQANGSSHGLIHLPAHVSTCIDGTDCADALARRRSVRMVAREDIASAASREE